MTGAVLDALESSRVQEALSQAGGQEAPHRAELLADIERAPMKSALRPAATWPRALLNTTGAKV